MPMASDV